MSISLLFVFAFFTYSNCQLNQSPGAPGPRNNWGGLGLQVGPPVPVTGQTSGGEGSNPSLGGQGSAIPGPLNNWGGLGLQIGRPIPVGGSGTQGGAGPNSGGSSGSSSSWNRGGFYPYWRRRYWSQNSNKANIWYGNHWNPTGAGFSG